MGGASVSSFLKSRLERHWCGRMYWPVPGSLRVWFSVRERRRNAGKCDNLSFLRVRLSQMDSVLGGTNGYAPLLEGGWPGPLRDWSLIRSSASSSSQTFWPVGLVFVVFVNGANQRIDRGQKGVWIVTKRRVTDKIRQKVVETFRVSGDDESRRRRPIYGYCTFWVIGIPFLLWLFYLMLALGRRGGQISKIELWFVANILEGFVEPFIESGGLVVVMVIGLIVDFVFVVRDWIRRRQRKEK